MHIYDACWCCIQLAASVLAGNFQTVTVAVFRHIYYVLTTKPQSHGCFKAWSRSP